MTLNIGSLLQGGKYKIIKVLGQGGFGITYLAEQTMLERKVAIKEFFMKEFCERDETTSHVTMGTAGARATVDRFREKFLKEARNIAKLKHPHIIQILDVFEENGTAYYVMEYAENGSLSTLVAENKPLPEAKATRYILQVADALSYIHQRKMNHLDIKPSNIMLNGEDETLLIDFGLSKQYDEVGQQTSTTPVGLSEGYAPMEQYKQGGVKEFSPETDIYALGATFFKLLTGKTPPGASDVNEDGLPIEELESNGVSQAAIDAITKAMEPRRKKRMHDVKEFANLLSATNLQTDSTEEDSIIEEETEEEDQLDETEFCEEEESPEGVEDVKEEAKEENEQQGVMEDLPQGFVASWKHFGQNIFNFSGLSNHTNYLYIIVPWMLFWFMWLFSYLFVSEDERIELKYIPSPAGIIVRYTELFNSLSSEGFYFVYYFFNYFLVELPIFALIVRFFRYNGYRHRVSIPVLIILMFVINMPVIAYLLRDSLPEAFLPYLADYAYFLWFALFLYEIPCWYYMWANSDYFYFKLNPIKRLIVTIGLMIPFLVMFFLTKEYWIYN